MSTLLRLLLWLLHREVEHEGEDRGLLLRHVLVPGGGKVGVRVGARVRVRVGVRVGVKLRLRLKAQGSRLRLQRRVLVPRVCRGGPAHELGDLHAGHARRLRCRRGRDEGRGTRVQGAWRRRQGEWAVKHGRDGDGGGRSGRTARSIRRYPTQSRAKTPSASRALPRSLGGAFGPGAPV